METMVLIALGSNRRHPRHGGPADVLRAAMRELAGPDLRIAGVSRLYHTAPLGPPQPAYVNATLRAVTSLAPAELLRRLQAMERRFGPKGRRHWGERVLDLDIIGYDDRVIPGRLGWRTGHRFAVPHRRAHERAFVLRPLLDVAPDWRHPVLGLTVRQLAARVDGRRWIRAVSEV